MAEAVAEAARRSRRASITSRATRSASTPVMPGRIAVDARRAAPRGRRRRRAAARFGSGAGRERARAVGAVAVEARAPVDDDERASRSTSWSPGSACGLDAVRAGARSPCRTTRWSTRARAGAGAAATRARARCGRPTSRPSAPRTRGRPRARRGGSSSISPSSFTARSASTMPVVGTSSRPARAEHLHLRVRQRVGLERDAPAQPLRQIARSARASSSSTSTPAPLGGLDVAEVREELRLLAGSTSSAAFELVEPGQVDGRWRRLVTSSGSSSRARSASRRAVMRSCPARYAERLAVAVGALADRRGARRRRRSPTCRRHSSRSSTFDRCTSTIGMSRISSASWIA